MAVILTLGITVSATAADYYIDPVNGSDDADGSLATPWASFANVISYYTSSYRPPQWQNIVAGDTVWLMDGTYSHILHPGAWNEGPTGGGSHIVYFRGEHGTSEEPISMKAYPGHHPVFDPQGNGIGIYIYQSSWWEFQGIEIANAYGRGMTIIESNNFIVHDMHIHDTDGTDNNNIAGLEIIANEIEIYDSTFNDNYDRTCADTGGIGNENSCNIVLFGGGNIEIHDCLIYQSPPLTADRSGGGIKYKHASRTPGTYFKVYNNVFRNCKYMSFGSGTANTHFHHNIIDGGYSIQSKDFGGPTHQVNQIFEYNTIYGGGFYLLPTIGWRDDDFPNDPSNIIFRNNIIYDTHQSYSMERAIVIVGTYMSDELYDIIVPELTFTNNCYYHPVLTIQFNIAAGWNDHPGYEEGDQYLLPDWQSTFGYDVDSINADPMFVDLAGGDFHLQPGSPAAAMGVYAVEQITGDYNNDGTVDQADYTVWADSYGQSGSGLPADGNNDGTIDQADYTIWADNYGQGTSPAGASDNSSSTVEIAVFEKSSPVAVDNDNTCDSTLLPQLNTYGTSYYVDQVNGHDNNPGTKALPWKTLLKAFKTIQPNDTIYMKITGIK